VGGGEANSVGMDKKYNAGKGVCLESSGAPGEVVVGEWSACRTGREKRLYEHQWLREQIV
jgi:hypothetical protein